MLRDALVCSGVGGNSGASFLPLPNPKPGEPTHIIADGANAVLQVRHPSWTACSILPGFFVFFAALSLGFLAPSRRRKYESNGCENGSRMGVRRGSFMANAALQVGRYDNGTEKLTLEPALFPIDHGTFAWQGERRPQPLADDFPRWVAFYVSTPDRNCCVCCSRGAGAERRPHPRGGLGARGRPARAAGARGGLPEGWRD